MGRNKKQPPLKRKSKEEKSCFRVDQSRALKAKKNKDSVRFSKVNNPLNSRINLIGFFVDENR